MNKILHAVHAGARLSCLSGLSLVSVPALAQSRQDDRTVPNSDATLFALGCKYFMSKRTNLYAVAAFIRNRNEAQYSPATAGAPGGFTRTPGEDGRAFQLGFRHQF